jgi:hypothetical protein
VIGWDQFPQPALPFDQRQRAQIATVEKEQIECEGREGFAALAHHFEVRNASLIK